MTERIQLSAGKNYEGAWVITAYIGENYAGETMFYYYTKREALAKAREMVRKQGGLGLYSKVIRHA